MLNSLTDTAEGVTNDVLQDDVNTSVDDVLTAAFGETMEPANTDAQDGEEKSPIQQKYGFDIVYDVKDNKFLLKQDEHEYDIGMYNADYAEWIQKLNENNEQIRSAKIKFEEKDCGNFLALLEKGENLPNPAISYSDGTIKMFSFSADEKDKDKCLEIMQNKPYNFSKEKSEKYYNILTTKDGISKLSLIRHEMAHDFDNKNALLDMSTLPPERMTRLEILTEVHAHMEQAALALDMYKKQGTLKYFDDIVTLDMNGLKEQLRQNPNMKNPEETVAKYVFDQVVKEANTPGTPYFNQVSGFNYKKEYREYSSVYNEVQQKDYLTRVETMFKNITSMGDINKYINPDFELSPELNNKVTYIRNENFKDLMGNNADNLYQYSENLRELKEKVAAIDMDGQRTPEEIAELDAFIQKRLPKKDAPSQTVTLDVSEDDKAKIAALSGRSGRYQSPESLQAEALQAEQTIDAPTVAPASQEVTQQAQTAQPQQAQPAPQQAVAEAQPTGKKVKDMSPQEKHEFINDNLRMGNNPNLSGESKKSRKKTKAKARTVDNTVAKAQTIQNAGR